MEQNNCSLMEFFLCLSLKISVGVDLIIDFEWLVSNVSNEIIVSSLLQICLAI